MKTITLDQLFQEQPKLLDALYKFINISNINLRNELIKSFCHNKKVTPILEKAGLLPDFLYYYIIGAINNM